MCTSAVNISGASRYSILFTYFSHNIYYYLVVQKIHVKIELGQIYNLVFIKVLEDGFVKLFEGLHIFLRIYF